MPIVSIVLPSYNGSKYIREALNSILNQTFTDWELIIVNDCSTDNTMDIAYEYSILDKRIRVIDNNVNKRLPASLNIGFVESVGKYLTWTSDDNIYMPDALRHMVEYLDNNDDCYLVTTRMEYIDAKGNIVGISTDYDDEKMYIQNCVGACFMYRRDVLSIIGMYDTERFLVEDYDYWLRIKTKCGKISFLDKVLYRYRKHEGSLTSTRFQQICYQRAKLITQYQKYVWEIFRDNPAVICEVYYNYVCSGLIDEFTKKIQDNLSVLSYESHRDFDKPVVIFGAGNFGEKTYEIIKEKVIGFVDNNGDIVGRLKCGKPIYAFDFLVENKNEYNICVAVGGEAEYYVIKQLLNNGIKEFWTYQWLNSCNLKENKLV